MKKQINISDHATLFSNRQGMGYVFDNETDINQFINKINITVGTETLTPGCMTDLDNYLIKKVMYLGTVDNNGMIFFYGTTNHLFENKSYYGLIYRVTETRIFEMFSPIGGRDHNFINGIWK